MNVSYQWLQTYFEKPLPSVVELTDLLTVRAFEIEEVKQVGSDWMIDVDVLPNRAHDCLSHRGIAREIGVLTEQRIKNQEPALPAGRSRITNEEVLPTLTVDVQERTLCKRYIGKKIHNVKVGESPAWLKERLEVIEQKSINNIVDAANYVMFDMGQPLHAFDADKVEGGIVVRKARAGEHITTLDGQEVALDESVLVIADEHSPLAIAGIKGGKKAEVDAHTKNIILEAANFDQSNIRKTTRVVNIQTDASKRFENEITHEYAPIAIAELTAGIIELAGTEQTSVEESVDVGVRTTGEYKIGVSLDEINGLLGASLDAKEVEDILDRFGFAYTKITPRAVLEEIIRSSIVLGKEYVSGASITNDAPERFDCSSLSAWLYREAGFSLPRISVDQFVFTKRVEKDDVQFGDLVFSNSGIVLKTGIHTASVEYMHGTAVPEGVDHLGMYLGDGKVLHTSSQTGAVVVEDLHDAKMFEHIVGYGRVGDLEQERYVVSIPPERLDLRAHTSFLTSGNKQDLIEEIGRVYGYENLAPQPLALKNERAVNKRLYYTNTIRDILHREGYVENYGYTFRADGEVEMAKALAQDKNFLRTNLESGLHETLAFNERYKDLLAIDRVRVFEFGAVFGKRDEHFHFALALGASTRQDEKDVLAAINEALGTNLTADIFGKQGGVFETNFDALIADLPVPKEIEVRENTLGEAIAYKKISQYPFMLRDIAVWTPAGTPPTEIEAIIKKHAGDLLAVMRIFDTFEKEGRVSYAFHLVFQSNERTLTDDEVGDIMQKIEAEMNSKDGWEVR